MFVLLLFQTLSSITFANLDDLSDPCQDLHKEVCSAQNLKGVTAATAKMESILLNTKPRLKKELAKKLRDNFMRGSQNSASEDFVEPDLTGFLREMGKDSRYRKPTSCEKLDLNKCIDQVADFQSNEIIKLAGGKPSVFDPGQTAALYRFESESALVSILRDELAKHTPDAQREVKLQSLFATTKKSIIAKIRNEVADANAAERMIKNIESYKYSADLCLNSNLDKPFDILTSRAVSSSTNEIGFCPIMSTYEASDAEIVHILAHEISHSIDPCNLSQLSSNTKKSSKEFPLPTYKEATWKKDYANYLSELPYGSVLSCLRQPRSLAAQFRDPTHKSFVDAGNSAAVSQICHNDQINEAFSDWIANDIALEFLKGQDESRKGLEPKSEVKKLLRLACGSDYGEQDLFLHPSSVDRINGGLMTHKITRKILDCHSPAMKKSACESPPKGNKNSPQEQKGIH